MMNTMKTRPIYELVREGNNPREISPRDEVPIAKWRGVCDWMESKQFKDRSVANKKNRSCLLYPHTLGRTSCLSKYRKMVNRSKITLWRIAHTRKRNGEFVNDLVRNKYVQMEEMKNAQMEEGEAISEDEILETVLGRRSGYQKGMGHGVEVPRQTTSLRAVELQAQLQASNEKINNLTIELKEQREENKKNKDEIGSLRTQMKQLMDMFKGMSNHLNIPC